MKLPLAYYGDPILRKKAVPVASITPEIRQFVADMIETMQAEDGCGLAAPQVQRSWAIFITSIPHYGDDDEIISPGQLRVFINPKIIAYSPEEWVCSEGCLSIPRIRGEISRPYKATVQAMDLDGNIFTEEFVEFAAHVILHENDHLNGVLFIDRLQPRAKKEIDSALRAIKKKYKKK